MSDQGMFQRNINSDGAAAQSFTDDGDIDSTSSVVEVLIGAAPITVRLPDQVASAGMRITVVSVAALAILTIGVTNPFNSLDGTPNGTVAIAAGVPFASLTFVSTGDSWVNV